MNNEIRLSLSAAREDDSQPLHIATEGSLNQLPTKHRKGWTPAPDPRAYMKARPDVYKGRDYEALTKAALRKPVGYWEDAPRGMEFGGGGEKARLANAPVPVSQMSHAAAPSAPTTPPPPQQSADGPWPKWLIANTYLRRFDGPTGGCMVFYDSGNTGRDPYGGWDLWSDDPRVCSQAEAAQWLEQNSHKDAAAQLRGKAADDGLYEPVGTMPVAGDVVRWGGDLIKITRIDSALHFSVRFNRAGGQEDGLFMSYFSDRRPAPLRILKRKPTAQTVAARAWKCTDGWLRCNVGANSFMRHPHMAWVREPLFDAGGVVQLITGNSDYTELHGPERDAIIAECCAAMNLDPKTGEPLHA